jgi:formylglycine-generating enzyme required for sulfatase activity
MLLTCNSANYNSRADWNGLDGNVSTVGSNGKSSYYGTFDQTGNVNELLDTISGSYPMIRGGSFNNLPIYLTKTYFGTASLDSKNSTTGFRIAKVSSSIDSTNYVLVEDRDNNGDGSDAFGPGRVNYDYQIKKYLVTNNEYVEFLNAISTRPNGLGLWIPEMKDPNPLPPGTIRTRGGINRTEISGAYTYASSLNMGNKPVNYINWFNAVRYINWLHNGKPTGVPAAGTTEDGVYTLSGFMVQGTSKPSPNNKNSYWLPSEDEWYKAAYYDPNKNGLGLPGYWTYATMSDSVPDATVVDNATGTGNNTYSNPNICISPTPTPTVTPSITVSQTVTPSITVSISSTATVTPTVTPTITITSSVTPTKTPTKTPTMTRSLTPTPSLTASVSPSITVSISPTRTPTMTRTLTPTVTPTTSVTVTPSKSLCAQKKLGELLYQSSVYVNDDIQVLHKGFLLQGKLSPNVSLLSEQPNASPTPTNTVSPTNTPTITVTNTLTTTPTLTRTSTPTPTTTSTLTPTPTPTPSSSG